MAANTGNIFKYKTFCVVTGASRGYGKTLSLELAKKFIDNSVIVLVARNSEALKNLKAEIDRDCPHVRVFDVCLDLAQQKAVVYEQLIQRILNKLDVQSDTFEQALIIHNAGSLGDVSKNLVEIDDYDDIQAYWDLNLTSTVALNSKFLKLFSGKDIQSRVSINISSICALQPFKSWSLYCAGKAARDMLFRTMAQEDPRVRVLNFAPGPIDTDMQLAARTLTKDKDLKDMFTSMHKKKALLSCLESVSKLLALLEENTFISGSHVDYYDL